MKCAVVIVGALCLPFTWGCEKTKSTANAPAEPGAETTAGSREAESAALTSSETDIVPRAATADVAERAPLTVAYSDWAGFAVWKIGVQKAWFDAAGVQVAFERFEYVPAMEAFAAGKVDAVTMTNADALVTASVGAASVGILLTSRSNGSHKIVARSSVPSVAALKGRTVGVELGFIGHLLLLNALETARLSTSDVSIINIPTEQAPEAFTRGSIDAVAVWQPLAGQVQRKAPRSTVVFTSADAPGLVYDLLYVSPRSLAERRDEWVKVARVWMRITEFVRDKQNWDEAVSIIATAGSHASGSKTLLAETQFLDLNDNIKHFAFGDTLASVHHSSRAIDRFHVANKIYKHLMHDPAHFDASLVRTLDSAANSVSPTPIPTAGGNQ